MMAKRRNYLLLMILAAAAAMPTVAPAAGAADGGASIPDFSGVWWHPSASRLRATGIGSNFADKQIAAQQREQLRPVGR